MPQQVKNPLLHQHDHDHHDHEHDDQEMLEQLDPAQQSLADALRVSFFILKALMALLLVVYLGSGIFTVDAQHKAVRLQFGRIVGQQDGQVYGEGWHLGLPYPIEQKVKVPTNTRSISISQPFTPESSQRAQRARTLNPESDGSLLTGDANIVHGKFNVSYHIADPADFVRNVGLAQVGENAPDGQTITDPMHFADQLVRSAAEQGVIYAVAQTDADAFVAGRTNMGPARARAQQVLDEMNTGLAFKTFVLNEPQAPRQVADAFSAVTRAGSQQSQLVDEARTEQSSILREAAGEAALSSAGNENGPLLRLILAYERALQLSEQQPAQQQRAQELERLINDSFARLEVPVDPANPDGPTVPIGAEAAQTIQNAESYRTGIVQQTRARAQTVDSLASEYQRYPRLLKSRLWLDAKAQILTSDTVETIYSMPGKPYLVTNRDPAVQREQERQRMQQQREQAQEAEE